MSDGSRYQQGPVQGSLPQQGKAQPPRAPEPEAPDFMQLAAMQLRQVMTGIDARVKTIQAEGNPGGIAEWTAEVREARLAVADRLIGLAQIQYDIPPDDDGELVDDEDDDYARR